MNFCLVVQHSTLFEFSLSQLAAFSVSFCITERIYLLQIVLGHSYSIGKIYHELASFWYFLRQQFYSSWIVCPNTNKHSCLASSNILSLFWCCLLLKAFCSNNLTNLNVKHLKRKAKGGGVDAYILSEVMQKHQNIYHYGAMSFLRAILHAFVDRC